MSKCSCCKQEITTAGCGCDVRLANEGLRDYARLLELEDGAETPEILVPLDWSDAIALIDRQKEKIAALTEDIRGKRVALENQMGAVLELKGYLNNAQKQIANLKEDFEAMSRTAGLQAEEIAALTALLRKETEEIRLLRRALGNCNPDHNLLMPEEALRGGEAVKGGKNNGI